MEHFAPQSGTLDTRGRLSIAQALEVCKKAAVAGGRAVMENSDTSSRGDGSLKAEMENYIGNRALVTRDDFVSQRAILSEVSPHLKTNYLLSEEHVKDSFLSSRIISKENLSLLTNHPCFIVDELDGSWSRNAGLPDWSVAVAYYENLVPVAGAIFIPEYRGGTLFFAGKGQGAFRTDYRGSSSSVVSVGVSVATTLAKAIVFEGVDAHIPDRYPLHAKFLSELNSEAGQIRVSGSSCVALASLANATAHAPLAPSVMISPRQSPWDWAAGKILIEEAGGVFLGYETAEDGSFQSIPHLETRHFNPQERVLAYVAGEKTLATELFERMLKFSQQHPVTRAIRKPPVTADTFKTLQLKQ